MNYFFKSVIKRVGFVILMGIVFLSLLYFASSDGASIDTRNITIIKDQPIKIGETNITYSTLWEKYTPVSIVDTSIGEKKLFEGAIIEHTSQSLINSHSIIQVYSSGDAPLISSLTFSRSVRNYKLYTQDAVKYKDINDYKTTCEWKEVEGTKNNSMTQVCTTTISGTHKEQLPITWTEYKVNTILPRGDYTLKIEANKYVNTNVDWIMESNGEKLSSWAWWDASWTKAKTVNITGGTQTLLNFPVFLNVSFDADMQADFDDLRFVDGACGGAQTTELSYEIDTKVNSNYAKIWLKMPTLAEGTNQICMYYGNGAATNGEKKADVWSNNYTAIWHLSEGTGTTSADSLGRMNITFLTGSPTWLSGSGCSFGNCLGFDGNDDMQSAYNSVIENTPIFLEQFANNSAGNDQMGMCIPWQDNAWGPSYVDACIYGLTNVRQMDYNVGGTTNPATQLVFTYSVGTIGYEGMGYDGTACYGAMHDKMYKTSNCADGTITFTSTKMRFGSREGSAGFWIGNGDELRISKAIRNSAWINRTADNVDLTLVKYGAEEEPPITDTEYPIFSNYQTNPLNASVFVEGANYNFSVTITRTNNTAGINFAGVNYSMSNVLSLFNKTFTNLSINNYTYYYWAYGNGTSTLYNQSAMRYYSITPDTAPPVVAFTYPMNNSFYTSITALNYTAKDSASPLSSCWYSTNNGITNISIACGTNATGLTSVEGNNTWVIAANDSLNNINSTKATFVIDTINPLISFGVKTLNDGVNVSQTNVYVNVSASDANEANVTFRLYNNFTEMLQGTNPYITIEGTNLTNLSSAYDNNWDTAVTAKYLISPFDAAINLTEDFIMNVTTQIDKIRVIVRTDGYMYCTVGGAVNTDTFIYNYALDKFTLINTSQGGKCDYHDLGGASCLWTCDRVWKDDISFSNDFINISTIKVRTRVQLLGGGYNLSLYEMNLTYVLYNSTTLPAGSRTFNWTGLSNGNYWYDVLITDRANNQNTTGTRSILLDTGVPVVEPGTTTPPTGAGVFSPSTNNTYYHNATQNFSVRINDAYGVYNASIILYNDSGGIVNQTNASYGGGIFSTILGIPVYLANGAYTIFIAAYDWASNVVTTAYNFIIDTLFPGISSHDYINTWRNDNTYIYRLNATITDTYLNQTGVNIEGVNHSLFTIGTNIYAYNFSKNITYVPYNSTFYFWADDNASNYKQGDTQTFRITCPTGFKSLNNSLCVEDLIFTGNQNITRYLTIPNSVVVLTSMSMNISNASAIVTNLTNVSISIGTTKIWNNTDVFNLTNYKIDGFISTLNNYLNSTYLIGTNYIIPLIFHSDTAGILKYFDIRYDSNSWIENSQTFNPTAYETTSQTFSINITYDTNYYSNIVAAINYNGTNYLGIKTQSGNNVIFNKIIDLPVISSAVENKSFLWQIELSNSSGSFWFNSTTKWQNIEKIYFTQCNVSNNISSLNITIYSTLTPTTAVNSNLKANLLFWAGNGINKANYTYQNLSESTSSYLFCITPVNNLQLDADFQFWATDYTYNNHYYRNASLTNVTTNQSFYLLNISKATITELQVLNEYQRGVPDMFIQIQLYNIGIGKYTLVGMGKTNFDGKDISYLNWFDSFYKFIITDRYGNVVTSYDPYKVSSTPQKFKIANTQVVDWWKFRDMTYNIYYNNNTQNVVATFLDVTGKVTGGCLRITRGGIYNSSVIYDQCIDSSSGTLTFNMGGQQEDTYFAKFYAKGSSADLGFLKILYGKEVIATTIYNNLGKADAYVYAFIIAGTTFFIGLFSPAAAVIAALAGLVLATSLGFMKIISISTFIIIAVGAIVFVWKSRS